MKTKGLLYALLTSFISMIILTFVGIWYTNHVSVENNRQWCELVTTLDEAYSGPARPTTELGKKVANSIHKLVISFDCPIRKIERR